MLVYKIDTGQIIAKIPRDQTIELFYMYEKDAFIDSIDVLTLDEYPLNYREFKVVDKNLVPLTEEEIMEVIEHKRFLTEEERTLDEFKPTHEEIQKAETTIEILSLLQEVL